MKTGRAGRASTIRLRRVKSRVYAVFAYEVKREGVAVAAFDVDENTVAAKIDLKAFAEMVARWNRDKIQPPISIHVFRTDFGRLARRYDAMRR